jgi:hypothetical protein
VSGIDERWAKPANLLDVQESEALVQMPDGRVMGDYTVSVDEETWERLSQGRICANCFEPLEEAFPEVCRALKLPDGTVVGCFYTVRKSQLRDMSMRLDAGQMVLIGPRVNKREELERLAELDAWEERTGLRLPDSVKFPSTRVEGRSKEIG